MRKLLLWLLLCSPVIAQTNLGPIRITTEQQKGFASAPDLPPAGYCMSYFDLNSGSILWLNHVGGNCNPGSAGSNAASIQGNSVDVGILTIPGTMYAENAAGSGLSAFTPYDIDSRYCALPTDNTTDVAVAAQACAFNHPGAHIRLWKTAAATGVCDYKSSQSVWMLGGGQWIDGAASGATSNQMVRWCVSQPGVPAFIATNQMAPAAKISNVNIVGQESWSRTNAATFVPAFGEGYPGIEWATVSTTASSAAITSNGTNETWTNQTDGLTIQILGAGAPQGTVSIATTANSYTALCTCTRVMIGQTVAIPGALGGSTLYAHIIGLTGTNPPVTGNAYLDQKPTSTVAPVSSTLSFDYYGTISSHSSASDAVVSPAVTVAVTSSFSYVGSTADGIRSVSANAHYENVPISAFGRHGINLSNESYPYIVTGGASNLSDNVTIDSPLIQANRGSGIRCQGGDCNLVHGKDGTISNNQQYAVNDIGFLGNLWENLNAATNHEDCTILPCPANGGSTGGFKNTTATWFAGVPYATAAAPPILVTDGTCIDSSTTVTTTASGKFKTGQADATNGQIVKLTGCGTAGADLTTFITGFTNANSITVADAATCGGGCPAGSGQIQVYPTVTIAGAPLFSAPIVNHSFLAQGAGPDGQALVTTVAIFYSTTKVGLNAAPKNRSIPNIQFTVYFGTSDYSKELNWAKAWDFTSGSITAAASTLTVTNANDLFISSMCSATAAQRIPITVVGAGPGGIDHVTTCSTFTNSQQVSLTDPAATTVGPTAEVRVASDGGSYAINGTSAPSNCFGCYGEIDQNLHPRKYGPLTTATSEVNEAAPAAVGLSRYSPFSGMAQNGLQMPLSIGNFQDTGGTINLFSGKNILQQIDFNWFGIDYTTKNARMTVNGVGAWQIFVAEHTAFNFASGVQRIYTADPAVTSGVAHKFAVNSDGRQGFAINADGSLLFSCNSASANCGKLISSNSALRTYTFPDVDGVVALNATGAAPVLVAKGTLGVTAGTAASGVCNTVTTTATGALSTDNVEYSFNASPAAVTGYGGGTTGNVVQLYPYLTANTMNMDVCNNTALSISYGLVTVRWMVTR